MAKQAKRHMGQKVYSTEGVDSINIDTAGNVGIGTTAPDGKITITTNQQAPGIANGLTIRNVSDGGAGLYFDNSVSANLGSVEARVKSTGAGTDDGVLSLRSATNGINTERATLDGSGLMLTNNVMNPYLRTYTANFTISQTAGAVQDLLSNSTQYADIHFIAFYRAFHSGRSWGMWSGIFGGYGGFIQRMHPVPAADAFALIYQNTSEGIGKLRFYNNNGTTQTADVSITILVFGEFPVTLHTGSITGQ